MQIEAEWANLAWEALAIAVDTDMRLLEEEKQMVEILEDQRAGEEALEQDEVAVVTSYQVIPEEGCQP